MSGGKLPEGWVTTHLSEICSKPQYGYTTKSSSMGDVKFLRTTDITKGAVNWSSVPYCMDAPEDVSKYQLQDRDIVISRAGSVGFSFLVQNPPSQAVFASYLIRFKPVNYFSEYYLKRFLESSDYWNQLSLMSAGNAVQNVNAQKLSTLTVPIAPIAEQKNIAEKLDTLLAQVDNIKARLEKIPQILKRFRQAVLAAAVSGELTKHLTQTKKNEVTLDKIATIIDPHPSHRTPKIDDAGIPYIGIGDIQPDGKINFTSARKVSVDVFIEHRARYTLNEGDFIFGKIGTLGKACVLPIGFKYTLSANVILIQPIKDKVSSDYLRYFLSSPLTMQEITQQANSTSQAAFGIKKMRAFKCNLPSLVEQAEIVRRVEQLFAYADTIEKQVNNALASVNNLTQSILAKAFRGELTAQWRAENPDLISGENSAAALLEKIKAERVASSGKKAARKKA
ncbi:restriction endonuclease subunit S [Pseudenterobacter timonensis]|uniref:Restriction endonuclease subunit S n=1 Tax=Pseudenterobacter timonensis TaxID=1755099 RepID=A0AAE4ITS6_9ENTR|nr:restriction endonuclease subunit S [Pseudenterobacter timonensis]MDR9889164.1 restriction endonuclease subunit S [Pseudenterobacter timonensis]